MRPLDALSSLSSCTSHYPLETTRVPKLSAACGSGTPTPPVADEGGVEEAGETNDASGSEAA